MSLWDAGDLESTVIEWEAFSAVSLEHSELAPSCKLMVKSAQRMLVCTHNILACAPSDANNHPEWRRLVPLLVKALEGDISSNASVVRCLGRVNELAGCITRLRADSQGMSSIRLKSHISYNLGQRNAKWCVKEFKTWKKASPSSNYFKVRPYLCFRKTAKLYFSWQGPKLLTWTLRFESATWRSTTQKQHLKIGRAHV